MSSMETRDEIGDREHMIPMEVDENDDGGCDPKSESFLDEYDNTNKGDENKSSLLNLLSTSNMNRSMSTKYRQSLRKSYLMVAIVFAASLFSATVFFAKQRTPVLHFRLEGDSSYNPDPEYSVTRSNQTFKIMQITDIHLGEAEYTDWGPRQDEKTFALLEKIFDYEPDCDLLVLGGDQLTANNCLGNCTKYYDVLGRFLSNFGVPWATIMGNHDDKDFEVEDGSGATIPHSYSRRELLRVDQKFPLSLSQASAKGELTGVTNYVLDVLDPITNQLSLQIFFLDSGGGTLKEAINDDQIEWFKKQAALDQTSAVPAVAFQHIPTWQHEYVDGYCFGYQGEGVAELEYDGGIVGAMMESKRFHFLAVGHNHGNDYCCSYNNNRDGSDKDDNQNNTNNSEELYFCFGRHSGYGGYGKWDRGVRIYELSLTEADEGRSDGGLDMNGKEFRWRTWVSEFCIRKTKPSHYFEIVPQ